MEECVGEVCVAVDTVSSGHTGRKTLLIKRAFLDSETIGEGLTDSFRIADQRDGNTLLTLQTSR
jgi:hypothetical protein